MADRLILTPPKLADGRDAVSELADQIRKLRRAKGWTLDELATASGVSRSMLSQVERGKANPTLAVAFRIARAFAVSLDDLVVAAPPAGVIEIIRSSDPAYYFRTDPECRVRTLSPLYLEKDVEFYEVTLAPGRSLTSAPHVPGTREFLTLERGAVRVRSSADSKAVATGDAASYPADVDHAIENVGDTVAVVFLVVLYRR